MQAKSDTIPNLPAWTSEDTYQLLLVLIVLASVWGFWILTDHRFLVYPDAMEYAQTARNLSEGQGATTDTIWTLRTAYPLSVPPADLRRPLLWPLVISGFFRVFGATDWVVTMAGAVMGCIGVGLFYLLARRFLGPRGTLFACLVYIVQPQILVLNHSGLSEPLFTVFVLAIAHVWLEARRDWRFLAIGVLVGLSQWVRLNGYLLILPVLGALIWSRERGWIRRALWILGGFAVVTIPIAVRNYHYLGEFSIVGLAKYSVVGEISPFPDHGAERSIAKISIFSVLASHPWEVAAKYIRGLSRNLTALFGMVHPLLWGLWVIPVLRSEGNPWLSRLCRYGFVVLVLFWAGFSIGEYEGSRFYAPLAPLIVLGGVVGLRRVLLRAGGAGSQPRASSWLNNWKAAAVLVVLLLPGVFEIREKALAPPSGEFRLRLGHLVQRIVPEDAVVGSDIPWAVGWYGRRLAVWLPWEPSRMVELNERLSVDYVVLSPGVQSGDWSNTVWPFVYMGANSLSGYQLIYPDQGRGPVLIFKRKSPKASGPSENRGP